MKTDEWMVFVSTGIIGILVGMILRDFIKLSMTVILIIAGLAITVLLYAKWLEKEEKTYNKNMDEIKSWLEHDKKLLSSQNKEEKEKEKNDGGNEKNI